MSTVTVQSYIDKLARRFRQSNLCYGHGTDNAFDEAVYLVYGALALRFEADANSPDHLLTGSELCRLDDLVEARLERRIPVGYLVGKAWFGGHQFLCDPRALIPRSPIAELIDRKLRPPLKRAPRRVLDLCAGGGCIGISCALRFPDCHVDLAEICADACELATANVALHELSARVSVLRSNLFSALTEAYDLIISNPPYVSAQELASLPEEYGHEPVLGLLSEDDGLALALKILREAADFLSADGVLIMEVGYSRQQLSTRLRTVPLGWLEFTHGGEGVLVLTRKQLQQYDGLFN